MGNVFFSQLGNPFLARNLTLGNCRFFNPRFAFVQTSIQTMGTNIYKAKNLRYYYYSANQNRAQKFLAIVLVSLGLSFSVYSQTSSTSGISINAGPDQTLTAGTTKTTLSGIIPTSSPATSSTDSLTFIVIWGESNAAGMAPNSSVPSNELGNRPGVQVYNSEKGIFENLNIGVNNQSPNTPTINHGFELGLANEVDSGRLPNVTYMVKIALGGTYISQWLPGASANLWGTYMPMVDGAIAKLNAKGKPYRIIVWQSIGLNDRYGQKTPVDVFMNSMQQFRTLFRQRYNRNDIQFLGTDFYNTCCISWDWTPYFKQMAQQDPGFHSIPVVGATYIDAGSHFDYSGLRLIAHNMTDTMLAIIARNSKASNVKYASVWSKVSGPAGDTIASPATAITSISGLVPGVYVYKLSVSDDQGNSATDNVQVTVSSGQANQAPVAKAGADITLTLPVNSATLNGSSSVDPEGSVLTYSWAKINGPAQFSLANSSAASTVLNNLVPGTYSFRLRVTDNLGATASDTVLVTVNAALPANQNPVANAGADITVTLPTNITNLNGSGSIDPDGSIASYSWTRISGPVQVTIANSATANTGISNLVQGIYTFQLKVTDNAGATATDLVNVTVNALAAPGNQAPVANVGGNINLTLPVNTATLNGSASTDPDGTISTYTWSKISGPGQFAIANPGQATTQVSNLAQGSYAFRLQVTDNGGLSGYDTLYITVNAASAPSNQLPVANAGSAITITLPTNSVGLDGTASWDPDGSIVSYSWAKVSGPGSSTISNSTTASPSITGLVFGQYAFELTVTDNSGGKSRDQVTVTVLNSPNAPAAPTQVVNQAPVAVAGENISIPMTQTNLTLNGSGSYDPDGSITTFTWKQVSGPSLAKISSAASATTQVNSLVEGSYVFELDVTDNSNASSSAVVKVDVVNTLRFTQSLKIYPNPVASILTFQYLSDLTGKIAVDIYSSNGALMFSAEYNKDQSFLSKQIDVSKFSKGLYYIKIIQPDGTKVSKSFWKK